MVLYHYIEVKAAGDVFLRRQKKPWRNTRVLSIKYLKIEIAIVILIFCV